MIKKLLILFLLFSSQVNAQQKFKLGGYGTTVYPQTIIQGSSSVGVADLTIPNAVLFDNDKYDAFPVAATRMGVPRIYIKSSVTHGAEGPMMFSKFENGLWTKPKQVRVDGATIECATLCIGVVGSRTYLAYQPSYTPADPYPFVAFAYSDTTDENFISSGQVNKRTGEIFTSQFGKIIQLPSGKLLLPVYAADATNSYGYFMQSTNNGVSWSVGSSIWSSVISATPAVDNGSLSELYVTVISGTTDANTKLICVARNDNYFGGGAHIQFSSTDGGSTWTRRGLVTPERLGSDGGNPMSLFKKGDMLYAIVGQRETNTVGGLGYWFNLAYIEGKADSVYNDPSKWSKKRYIYKGITGYKANGADFGYPEGFDYNGNIYLAFYDHSTVSTGAVDIQKRIRIGIYPLLGNNYMEAFNATNQAVSTATSTEVSFPNTMLDGVGYTSTVTNKFIIPSDGMYTVSARVIWDNSNTTGTFREIKIQVVDNGAVTQGAYGIQYECATAIAPSGSARIMRMELKSASYLFHKGYEVKILAEHDATGSVNIINTGVHTKALLTIIKD